MKRTRLAVGSLVAHHSQTTKVCRASQLLQQRVAPSQQWGQADSRLETEEQTEAETEAEEETGEDTERESEREGC